MLGSQEAGRLESEESRRLEGYKAAKLNQKSFYLNL